MQFKSSRLPDVARRAAVTLRTITKCDDSTRAAFSPTDPARSVGDSRRPSRSLLGTAKGPGAVIAQGPEGAGAERGRDAADWRAIYLHRSNPELRKKRPNPSLLFPGDELFIPEKRRKTVTAQTGKELMDDGLPSGVNEPRHPAPRHIRLMRSEIGLLRNQ